MKNVIEKKEKFLMLFIGYFLKRFGALYLAVFKVSGSLQLDTAGILRSVKKGMFFLRRHVPLRFFLKRSPVYMCLDIQINGLYSQFLEVEVDNYFKEMVE